MRAVAPGLLLMSVLACETPSVPFDSGQYEFRLLRVQPPRTFHWGAGADVPVFVNQPEVASRPNMADALDQGATVWTRAAVFGEVRLRRTTNLDEAVAVLQWKDVEPILSTPVGCDGPGIGAASTSFCLNLPANDSLITWPRRDQGPSNVLFNVIVEIRPDMDADLLELLVTHEMGHVMGILAHSNSSGDLMWAGIVDTDGLSGADRQTLRTLYQSTVDLAH